MINFLIRLTLWGYVLKIEEMAVTTPYIASFFKLKTSEKKKISRISLYSVFIITFIKIHDGQCKTNQPDDKIY